MKSSELRDLSAAELKARLTDEKNAMQKMRFDKKIKGNIERPSDFQVKRKNVARILTILNEKK
ncbi:MAG: 50S ribosomal protein L29 [Bacteroidetes bacterium]|jgi:ribosomal protein L29|nr:50S ribosomal protein L29 [Bacteroidota bacterium]NCQ11465.1 50S ribosomal protein L29 [Bacteroidota bacterium]